MKFQERNTESKVPEKEEGREALILSLWRAFGTL